jgi:hypothetical protein
VATVWYAGYGPAERGAKGRAVRAAMRAGTLAGPRGPCSVCGDRRAVQYHSEDYSRPYRFAPPAMYVVCGACHAQLHLRFAFPRRWAAFVAHVERGGFGREFGRLERPARGAGSALGSALVQQGELFQPAASGRRRGVRPGAPSGTPWWRALSLDPATRADPRSRPRP